MPHNRLHIDSRGMPAPYDTALLARGKQAWAQAVSTADQALAEAAAPGDPAAEALIDGILGCSPFLSALLARRTATALSTLAHGPEEALAAAVAELATGNPADSPALDEATLMRRLRLAKQDVALIVAVADLAGAWDLRRVTAALSDFADLCVRLCIDHLIASHARRGAWAMPAAAPAHAHFGLVTLAMGKLGARELNYSSDVDLVLLYDSDMVESHDIGDLPSNFNRFSRDLNRLIESRTADGYVFRTDLRLRPDPGATPPVISLAAAEGYYHSVGQTWERAAMIKARPITGSPPSIKAAKAIIEPFVWRRHLDFWAIEDVHAVKKQIHARKGGGRITVAGHNIKLGRGGIREVEFFAQTQQLIWGGREPPLRTAPTVDALDALVEGGHVARPVADELIAAYRHLRRVEHRLQMIEDQQTHTLPRDAEELRRVACLAGEVDPKAFAATLTGHLGAVHRHYADLFEESQLREFGGNLVFTGTDLDPGTVETLTRFGFGEPERVTELVRGWFAGRYRATRSERAQALMNRLVPDLLQAFGRTAEPDAAISRFDRFLQGLPSGVQIFSLFAANPQLLAVVAEMMGSAPRLADYLAHHPAVLDAMLGDGFFSRLPKAGRLRTAFADRLARAADFEAMLDQARALTNDIKFQVNLQLLRGTQTVEAASRTLADLAEAAIEALLPRVEEAFAARYGRIENGAFAILALGRLGSQEMTARSDLDLVFVYDAPATALQSSGPKQIPVSQYFAQLGQRMIAALTAPTASGRLYDVDMRLRPSGNAGPVAVSLARFADYQRESAWSWEHMALTRARVVAVIEPPGTDLAARLEAAVRTALVRPRNRGRLAVEVDDMRERVRKQFGSDDPWDVKQRDGGLTDIEFVTQFLQLAHAGDDPDCLATSTVGALDRLADRGALARDDADTLRAAHRLWHAIQSILRLTVTGRFEPDTASADQRAALARATGAIDFPALVAQMAATGEAVQLIYARIVGVPAAAARARAEPEGERQQGE